MISAAGARGTETARCESNCRDTRLSKESRPQPSSEHQQTPFMKIRPALAWLAAFPILSPVVSAADTPASPPAAAAPAAAPGSEKKTELEMRMDRIGKAFRKLKKQVGDPAQNAASLELLSAMEAAAKEAIELTPEKAEDIPEDQRAKFEAD